MNRLAQGCDSLNLNAEMMFRITDKKRSKSVLIQDFGETLRRVKLQLDSPTIARVCSILGRSGVLTHLQYHQYLAAYKLDTEQPPWDPRLNFFQQSIKEFSKGSQGKSGLSVARDISESSEITFNQFSRYCLDRKKMTPQQIVAVFLGLDNEDRCRVKKSDLAEQFQQAAKLTGDQQPKTGGKEGGKDGRGGKAQQGGSKDGGKDRGKDGGKDGGKSVGKDGDKDGGKDKIPNKPDRLQQKKPVKPTPDAEKGIRLFKELGIGAKPFLSQVIKAMYFRRKAFVFQDFLRVGTNIQGKKVNKLKCAEIFSQGDVNANGSISLEQMASFYCKVKDPRQDFQPVLLLTCNKMKAAKLDPSEYLEGLGIAELDNSNIQTFLQMGLAKATNSQVLQTLRGMSKQKLQNYLTEIGEFSGKQFLKFKKDVKTGSTDQDQLMRKIKPEIQEKDCFLINDRNRKEGDKVRWQSIFTNQLAALKFCHQQFQKTRANGFQFWLDSEFGPNDSDPSGMMSIKPRQDIDFPGLPPEQQIQWVQLQKVHRVYCQQVDPSFKDKRVVFIDQNAKAVSVMQGMLGDCWFISSMSLVSTDDRLLRGELALDSKSIAGVSEEDSWKLSKGVFAPLFQIYAKRGIYCMKFYKESAPVWVVVDSLLPKSKSSPELLFAKTRNYYESWVPLVEKAYAKLHFSYSALIKGQISQGLADLTNGVPLKVGIGKKLKQGDRDKLWRVLVENVRGGNLLGCSANGEGQEYVRSDEGQLTGIFARHAYYVTDAFQIEDPACENYHKSHRLVRVNNPHGIGEWLLKWSEFEENGKLFKFEDEIKRHYQQEVSRAREDGRQPIEDYVFNKGSPNDDGSFLMCFKDWRTIFNNMFLCKFPKPAWTNFKIEGKYRAGGGDKPEKLVQHAQFIVRIACKDPSKASSLSIVLKQVDGRVFKNQVYPFTDNKIAILHQIFVFRLAPGQSKLTKYSKESLVAFSGGYKATRTVEVQLPQLSNGVYAVVPVPRDDSAGRPFSLSLIYEGAEGDISVSAQEGTVSKEPFLRQQRLSKEVLRYFKQFYEANV